MSFTYRRNLFFDSANVNQRERFRDESKFQEEDENIEHFKYANN